MKKPKIDIALLNSIKFCVYPASIEDKTIDIPQDELEDGSEELSVRYLIKTYGFKIQSVIPGSVVKKQHYDPELKTKPVDKKSSLPPVTLPKRGDIWKRDEERLYIKNVTENNFEITYLNSLKGNKTLTKSSVESLVRSGVMVIEPTR